MAERPRLWVEGDDDLHTILHLLIRLGIGCDESPLQNYLPCITKSGDKDKLLRNVRLSVSTSTGRAVGFVLDADSSLQNRWMAMSSRLREAGVDPPEDIPPEGFMGESQTYRTRVGVWLMPDNQQEGTLEDFLRTLVEEEDPLLPHAQESTTQAKRRHGANYHNVDEKKSRAARLACVARGARLAIRHRHPSAIFPTGQSGGRALCGLVSSRVRTRVGAMRV